MAKIKLTESELRNLIKKVINESSPTPTTTVQIELEDVELENGEYASFGITGKLYYYKDGDYDIDNLWLTEGSYDVDLEIEIEKWISDNRNIIIEKIFEQAKIDDEIAYDQAHEYDPDNF